MFQPRNFVLIVAIFAVAPSHLNAGGPPQSLPAEIVEPWEKAGAISGWMSGHDDGLTYRSFQERAQEGDLPAFRLLTLHDAATLAKLPAPNRGFALSFDEVALTSDRVKALAGFGELRRLSVRLLVPGTDLTPLKAIKKLDSLVLKTVITKAIVDDLATLSQVESMQLNVGVLNEERGQLLAELKQLKSLQLTTPPTRPPADHNLGFAGKLKQLHSLDLGWLAVTDAALKTLDSGGQLKAISVRSNALTDQALAEIARIKGVETLSVDGSLVQGGFKDLARIDNLKHLRLYSGVMTGAGIKDLSALKNLESLNLYSNKFNDAGVNELAGLPRLKTLILQSAGVTDKGIHGIAKLTQLRDLVLRVQQVESLAPMKDMTDLERLVISSASFRDDGIKGIGGLKKLRVLEIPRLTDPGLEELANLRELRTLHTSDIIDSTLGHLAGLESIEVLNLPNSLLTDAGLKHVGKMKTLTYLNLSFSKRITDAGLKELASLKQLRTLDLNRASITDVGLAELKSLGHLQRLYLGSVGTKEGIRDLRKALPKTWIVSVHH